MEKINTVKGTKDLSGFNLMMHKKVCEIFSKLCESKSFQEIKNMNFVQYFHQKELMNDLVQEEFES